jgi:hypothetical protein
MNGSTPNNIKIYHIMHISKLASVIEDGCLFSDAEIRRRPFIGETIGMTKIKDRRLRLPLSSHSGLYVGDCVPFYFCPRSIMLYMFFRDNHPDITYHGGQEPIIHLVADLNRVVEWANHNHMRWAFTSSNAGSGYFEDFRDLRDLNKINWQAVNTNRWSGCKEEKQAEFLLEQFFPWELIEKIGVSSWEYMGEVSDLLARCHKDVLVRPEPSWYY